MNKILLFSFAMLLAFVAWSQQSRQTQPQRPAPPTTRQLMDILLKSRDVPRNVDVTCATVGSEPTDRTLGDYVASMLTEYARPGGRNWITASCKPAPANDKSGAVWHCEVAFHRQKGEEIMDRGLFFRLMPNSEVVANSYICTGGN